MPQQVDKRLVARRFGQRAASYEAATPVQAAMAQDLHDHVRVKLEGRHVGNILELGCGSGRLTRMLRTTWPGARIVSIDIANDMLELARRDCPSIDFVLADAEALLQNCDERFDLLISNATVQWFQTPEYSLPRCRTLLNPSGLAVLTTFGRDTFWELRAAFTAAYDRIDKPSRQHTGEFPEIGFYRELLPQAEIAEWHVVKHFADVRSFLRSVQIAGASNAFARSGFVSRDVLRLMQDLYANRFSSPDGHGVAGTYHVVRITMTEESSDGSC